MHAFQAQNATMTLAEGLAEYFDSYPALKRGDSLSAPARQFFQCHDVAHVIFGCDTSLTQEAVVKLSSLFGTTAGLSVLRGYALHDSQDIYRTLKAGDIFATVLAAFTFVPQTLARRIRQKRRWPWSDFSPFLDRPLCDIRSEFGIQV